MTERVSQTLPIDRQIRKRKTLAKALRVTGVGSAVVAALAMVDLGFRTQEIADVRTSVTSQRSTPRPDSFVVFQHVQTATAHAYNNPGIPAKTAIPDSLAILQADQTAQAEEDTAIAKHGLKGKFDRALAVSLAALATIAGTALGYLRNDVVVGRLQQERDAQSTESIDVVSQERVEVFPN